MAETERELNSGAWDERYQQGQTGWDLGHAAPPLESWLSGPQAPAPGLRVAVPGCGYGHDALLFARAGHTVTGFDFAPSAVAEARQRAARAGLPAAFEQADIFALPEHHRGAFDLVVEHTCFCAIDPARRADYVAAMHGLLRDGGLLVGLFWNHGRPGGPPFTTTRQEVEALFAPHFVIQSLDRVENSVASRAGQEMLAVMRKEAPWAGENV